jgi:hypothetical protein
MTPEQRCHLNDYLATKSIVDTVGTIAGLALPFMRPGALLPRLPEIPATATPRVPMDGPVARGKVHPSWLDSDGQPKWPLWRDLSRQLNTSPKGVDISVDLEPRMVTRGPSCSIYGNCGDIANRAPWLLRYPASEVLGGRLLEPMEPFRGVSVWPSSESGSTAAFAANAEEGQIGVLGTDNFKGLTGRFADHGANILQTPRGPIAIDFQRGAQVHSLRDFGMNSTVRW